MLLGSLVDTEENGGLSSDSTKAPERKGGRGQNFNSVKLSIDTLPKTRIDCQISRMGLDRKEESG